MGILRIDHPDIKEFITCKQNLTRFTNFNISVAVTDAFMQAVKDASSFHLRNPRTGEVTATVPAVEIMELIVKNAHAVGDPGLLFIDRVNETNPTPHLGQFESTNPCGEQPLLPYESCNLGSVNLTEMIDHSGDKPIVDWSKLARTVHLAVRFLDNVIEVNRFPLDSITDMTRRTRKIGLGVMGFADMLIRLGVAYDSEESEHLADQLMSFVTSQARNESRHLAEIRGAFPAFEGSVYDQTGETPLRNATTTTVAPTGTISILASCSSGIEPLFALAYTRNVLDGQSLTEFHPYFKDMATHAGILDDDLISEVLQHQSIADIDRVPPPLKRIFRTTSDISVDWHIRIQAAFQRHTDNAVSKTINLPHEAELDDVAHAYMTAWESGCKGITIYRDGSRAEQVLSVSGKKKSEPQTDRPVIQPRPRPPVTTGATEKLVTGCGNLYVTVNRDEDGLCEVFCQMGRSGGCTASQSEAISRLISLSLRSGIKLDEIISQLKGIRCPSPIWQNGKMILSCADAIATALARHLERNGKNEKNEIPVLTIDDIDPQNSREERIVGNV